MEEDREVPAREGPGAIKTNRETAVLGLKIVRAETAGATEGLRIPVRMVLVLLPDPRTTDDGQTRLSQVYQASQSPQRRGLTTAHLTLRLVTDLSDYSDITR